DGNGVDVYFANGRRERADLLVGCDGFRSGVRAQLAPETQPIYSGYYIWRGAPNEADLSPETRRTMFPYYNAASPHGVCRIQGRRRGAGPGRRRFQLRRPRSSAFRLQLNASATQ